MLVAVADTIFLTFCYNLLQPRHQRREFKNNIVKKVSSLLA